MLKLMLRLMLGLMLRDVIVVGGWRQRSIVLVYRIDVSDRADLSCWRIRHCNAIARSRSWTDKSFTHAAIA